MSNIILIGMPGAGKSTIGVVLAKAMAYGFIDSDLLIQEREGKVLSDILEEVGTWGFNKIEEEVNASINVENTVIATGGSVIYGPKAMEHFRKNGTIVYIKLPCEVLKRRIGDFEKRGIAMKSEQSFEDLYAERVPLYERYAHVTVETEGLELRESMARIKKIVMERMGVSE
ncbi:MAG: shikimate kinase [Anaerovoracaceae bacterium]